MRQLFICTSAAVLAATNSPQDLTNVAAGTIGMWENGDDSNWLSAAPTADFSIAYGRPNSQAVVIPIDFASAHVTVSTPQKGKMFKADITIPEPVAGKDYTLQLIKLGTEIMSVILGLLQIMVHIKLLLLLWQSHLVTSSLI